MNKISKHLSPFLLILFFAISISYAQQFNFKNYNVNDGLAQPYVYTINQGTYGKLWIGTGEGLSSFDGKKFQNYSTQDGLAENFVTASFKDNAGNIWLGHYQGGLSIYDNHSFKTVAKNIAQSPINTIGQDKDGNIWIGSQSNGLVKIDAKNKITLYPDLFPTTAINAIVCVESGHLIVATNDGLQVLLLNGNAKPKLINTYLEYIAVTKITKVKDNQYLLATNDEGVQQLDIMPNNCEVKQLKSDIELTAKNINLLQCDHDSYVWIGCFGEGIYKFKNTPAGLVMVAHYNKASGLSNDYIKSLFIDREGDIWMGTFGTGIEILIDPIFTLYAQQDGLLSNNVNALYSEGNNLWVANNTGVVRLSFSKYKLNDLSNKKIYPTCAGGAKITSILNVQPNIILLGTDGDGIWKLDITSGKAIRWFYSKENILTNKINHLAKDKNKNIWVATEDGAFQLQSSSEVPIAHLTMESGLLHNNIFSIFVDSKNIIWFATHGSGISTYQNEKIVNYPSPNETSGIDINCFSEDRKGQIWIGSYGQGLYKFNGKKVVQKYTQKNGLGSNYCYITICDKNNNLWIGHKNGISKYDSDKNSFIFYQKKEGFLVEEINSNATIQDFENNIWFGSTNGLLRYNLNADKPQKVGPVIGIVNIDLFFQKMDWSKYADSLTTLAQLPLHLALPYHQNHFTFHVRGISFVNPDKVKYQYKLEGFDNSWSLITKEDFVTYPNIPPGHYTFKVVAANQEGIWSETPAQFAFTILNPFWKTWWFTALMAIGAITLFLLILKLRTNSLEREQKILQEEKIKLLAEITERKLTEGKLQESEDQLKETNKELNTFIYRASHDLRGPLSTVKGLTNLGIMEITDPASLKYFELISDRINRLDFILKDLINIVEVTEVPLHVEEINLPALVANVVSDIKANPLPKPLQFHLNIDSKVPFLGDKKILQSVLFNLFDNAVKYYNNDRFDIIVSIEIIDYKNGILIQIVDNGIGIPQEIQSRIFDMFFRGTDQSKGSGLGLYLVKKIVNRLNGKIKVSSMLKSGTQIELFLPSNITCVDELTEQNQYPTSSME